VRHRTPPPPASPPSLYDALAEIATEAQP